MEKSIDFYKKKLLTVKPNTVSSKYLKFMIKKLESRQKGVKKSVQNIVRVKKKYKIKKKQSMVEMSSFTFPKILHLYWDLSVFSYLNLLTIESFNRYHDGWEIYIHTPKNPNQKINWSSFEHKLRLTGKSYFERLKSYPNVKFFEVDFDSFFNINFLKDASEIVKSDYLRYHLLVEYGGIWSDFDILYINNIEDLLNFTASNVIFHCSIKETNGSVDYYPIGFFAAEKGSKLFRYILKQCENFYNKDHYQTIGANMWNVLFAKEESVYKIDPQTKILDNTFYLPLQCDKFADIFLRNKYHHFGDKTVGIHWFNGSDQSKHYQNQLDERLETFQPKVFIDNYVQKYIKSRNILLFSESSYPGGGGEEFLLDVAKFFHKKAYNVFWLNFHDWGQQKYDKNKSVNHEFYTQIKMSRNIDDLTNYDYLKPFLVEKNINFIFTQGKGHKLFCDLGNWSNIPTITIWCFWEEALEIDWKFGLQQIEKNLEYHQKSSDFMYMKENFDFFYVASPFVKHILEKKYKITIEKEHIFPTFPQNSRFEIQTTNHFSKDYITLFDAHTLKGGKIMAKLIEANPTFNFLAIKTEEEEDGPKAIQQAMKTSKNPKNIFLSERVNDVKTIYEKTRIVLMLTYLDETFGRVVYESFVNEIPVIFGNCGNLQYIKGENILNIDMFSNPFEEVNKLIQKLSKEELYYKNVVKAQKKYLKEIDRNYDLQRIENKFLEIESDKEKNIGIFTPWCDQGLGIQSRIYKHVLEKMGYNVFIFATKPYLQTNASDLVRNEKEWETDRIYYSPNRRLDINNIELDLFVQNFKIKKFLIPEIRYDKLFEITEYLKSKKVKTIAIPNIDCTMAAEVPKYNQFHKVALNNFFCDEVLKEYGHYYSEYIGFYYTVPPCIPFEPSILLVKDKIKFLHLSGLNGMDKKHTKQIIEVMENVYKEFKNFELHIIIQGNFSKELANTFSQPFIHLVQDHVSYQDILQKYNESHISIHMSKNEGLGLGLFESCFTNTPVITLDAYPYKEIIMEEKNGWLIPSFSVKEKFYYEADLVVEQNNFKTDIASQKILTIVQDTNKINTIIQSTKSTLEQYYSFEQFEGNIKKLFF